MKKQKVQCELKRSLLFGECPDEIVLIILFFCSIQDIRSTRVYQTEVVRHSTVTRIKVRAAENDNLDNLQWIHDYIGDTEFCSGFGEHGEEITCTGNNLKTSLRY